MVSASVAFSCSAGDGGGSGTGGVSSGGSSANGGSGGTIGVGGTVNVDGNTTGGSGGFAAGCAADTHEGEQLPLDLVVMLDRSGSMTEDTAAGPTKWEAVTQALTSFVTAPTSAGLGVGLQYFPLIKAGVPETCTNDSQCGTSGPCLLKTCLGGNQIIPCTSNGSCGPFGQCADLGYCSGNPAIYCAPVGSTACGNEGNCVKLSSSSCINATSCLLGDYTNLAVPIALLPGNETALVNSINAQDPYGDTPTGPALQGAIDQAKAYNQANPTHRVAVVLATDGLPTSCNPTQINQIAQLAASAYAGTPSVVTFVIGVFAGNDNTAKNNLNTIATAGGSGAAFMVDTGQNVTQQFQAALDQIKGTALACEFQIPTPTGGTLDYGKVNIEVSSSDGTQTLFYVGSAAQCDPVNGGWYYDIDPSAGTPTKILVCPATCAAFKAATDAKVQVLIGCQTIVPA
jgi:hypothetical protein